jgi:hypothetical protein
MITDICGLQMTPRNKVTAVEVQLRIDLAREIFRESGNLPISDFPATLEFSESLAEVLNLDHKDTTELDEKTLLVQNSENILMPIKRKK